MRGEQIRKIKSHVKAVVLSVRLKNGKRFILTAASGGSYASEVKLGKKILEGVNSRDDVRTILKDKPFLGDKGYDSVEFIEQILRLGFKPYIKVRERFRRDIRSEVRRKCKEFVESDVMPPSRVDIF